MYDYREAMTTDIKQWLEDNANFYDNFSNFSNRADFTEWLYDRLFVSDEITGNASGSYTFSTYKAAENLISNSDLLIEAIECFGDDPANYRRCIESPETADVIIRCHLLGEAIETVVDEMIKKGGFKL